MFRCTLNLFSQPVVGATSSIPFKVRRTRADNIPVYTIKRFNKSLVFTQVRKVRGNVETMRDELSHLCGSPAKIISDGVIEINGNYKSIIKQWLQSSGF